MPRKQTIERDGVEVYLGFRIRARRRQTCTRYRVEVSNRGVRTRRQFPTIAQARAHCVTLARDRERLGASALNLDDADRQDAARAKQLLAGSGLSILDAARIALDSGRHRASNPVTVADLVDKFLGWMLDTPVKLSARVPGPYRPTTIAGIEKQLSLFARDLNQTPAADLDPDTLRTWLDSRQFSPANWDHHRRAVSILYTWAARDGA
ncbi:MAG: hypothetical protein WC489_09180, partial [Patescibacteria group bacterium]